MDVEWTPTMIGDTGHLTAISRSAIWGLRCRS